MIGRVAELDLVIPALRFMSAQDDGFISTENLIVELTDLFQPSGKDAQIIEGRSDTYFSQKVRNLISHRGSNFIKKGFAEYLPDREGLKITPAGENLLKSIIE